MKILLVDLETSPNTAYVWRIYKENIPISMIIDTSKVLCWTAKWLGEEEIIFDSIYKSKPKTLLKRIHKLMDEADAVVTYNGNRFDIPVLNKEFLLNGFTPPAPYKSVDLYKVVKNKFKFVSNKLDFVCQQLKLGKKIETDFSLWVKCMQKDPAAWEKMEAYNKNDVLILEKLFTKLVPWTKLPNRSVHTGNLVCPKCGSESYQRRGYILNIAGKYARYQCGECGGWFRGNVSEAAKEKFIGVE